MEGLHDTSTKPLVNFYSIFLDPIEMMVQGEIN